MANWQEHIVHDPQICGGVATLKGTRIMVTVVLDNLAAGVATDRLLDAYPTLRPEHIPAALAYAAYLAHEEADLPLTAPNTRA